MTWRRRFTATDVTYNGKATNNRKRFTRARRDSRRRPHVMSALAASVAAPRRASYPRRRARARLVAPARASAETRAAGGSTTEKKGKVFLIGAGPGGIDHVTVRALRLLRACDVVVHDDLGASDAALLDEAPPNAERVHAGKRGGDARSWTQPDIDNLLVSLCEKGKIVARLKGGCPSVFSRARSEMDALARNGFSYELVPGISSALAAPLRAGSPSPTPKSANTFSCARRTTRRRSTSPRSPTWTRACSSWRAGRWTPCARGLARGAGKDGSTPAVVVRDACGDEEAVWRGTLSSIRSRSRNRRNCRRAWWWWARCARSGTGTTTRGAGTARRRWGGDVEPGSVAVSGDFGRDLADLDLANLDLDLDETAAGKVVELLRRMVQDRDARIKELEEELLVSKRAARMLRGRK